MGKKKCYLGPVIPFEEQLDIAFGKGYVINKSKSLKMKELRPVYPSEKKTVRVEDDPIYGGAHKYEMDNCIGFHDGETKYEGGAQGIQFVQKNDDGSMIPGLQSEQLLIMLIDRHKKLNERFPSPDGQLAIEDMESALLRLEQRVRERMQRNVMGDLKK